MFKTKGNKSTRETQEWMKRAAKHLENGWHDGFELTRLLIKCCTLRSEGKSEQEACVIYFYYSRCNVIIWQYL